MSTAGSKGTVDTLRELWELLRSYALQETVTPFKSLGRSLGWGLGGAVLISGSVLFFALGVLRLLQTETTVFDDKLSWLAYLIVVVVLAGIVGLAAFGINRSRRRGKRPAAIDSTLKGTEP